MNKINDICAICGYLLSQLLTFFDYGASKQIARATTASLRLKPRSPRCAMAEKWATTTKKSTWNGIDQCCADGFDLKKLILSTIHFVGCRKRLTGLMMSIPRSSNGILSSLCIMGAILLLNLNNNFFSFAFAWLVGSALSFKIMLGNNLHTSRSDPWGDFHFMQRHQEQWEKYAKVLSGSAIVCNCVEWYNSGGGGGDAAATDDDDDDDCIWLEWRSWSCGAG